MTLEGRAFFPLEGQVTVFSLERLSCREERNTTSPFSRWLVFANLKGQADLLEGLRRLFFLSLPDPA